MRLFGGRKKSPMGDHEGPVLVKCSKCRKDIVVASMKRPILITCPNCGNKGKLSK